MASFRTAKEAKDYIAERIAAEAARESVPLSEVERKMLYWSETDWTLPDMKQVGAEFERDYDDTAYEQKITRLVANLTADHHHQNEAEEEKWDAAVYKLSEGDHYLSVLVGNTESPGSKQTWTTAFAIAFAALLLTFAINLLLKSEALSHLIQKVDDRAKILLLVLVFALGYFLVPRLWQLIRARTNRP